MIRRNRIVFSYEAGGNLCSFQVADGLLLESIDGADGLPLSYNEAGAPDGIGSPAWNFSVYARPVTLNGYILSRPADAHIAIMRRCFAPNVEGLLFAKDAAGKTYFLSCKPSSTPVIEPRTVQPRFQIQLRADYPYWQRDSATVVQHPLNAAAEIVIAGSVAAVYTAEIRLTSGSADRIVIRDDGSGDELRYEARLEAGQLLRIQNDTSGRIACTVDGDNAINAITGSLRKLLPGARSLTIDCGVNSSGSAAIIYREAIDSV